MSLQQNPFNYDIFNILGNVVLNYLEQKYKDTVYHSVSQFTWFNLKKKKICTEMR